MQQTNVSGKKIPALLAVAALSLIFIGASCNKNATDNNPTIEEQGDGSDSINKTEVNGGAPAANIPAQNAETTTGRVKTFNVEGGTFYFNPKEIRVRKGDTVKIVFTNKEGFHDWVIDEFNARTTQMAAGKTETIQFVADKTGTFEYYCSVGQHRANGMKGNLIVE